MIYIAKTAVIVGDVTIGKGSSVWHGTVLRGDLDAIVIGQDTNLQDRAVAHLDTGAPTIIGDRVTVGHGAIVHGCEIGSDSICGMGSVVSSRARVGSDCIIGAGAVVTEEAVIADGSIAMGVPARVVGPTTDAHRLRIEAAWRTYAELARTSLPARREMKGNPAKRTRVKGAEGML